MDPQWTGPCRSVTVDGAAQTGCPRLWPAPSARPALGRARDPAWAQLGPPLRLRAPCGSNCQWAGADTVTSGGLQVATRVPVGGGPRGWRVCAGGGRADGKGRDAAHGCQRCRQRLRLHVEINPNRVDSALSLSQCCLVSCRVPAGTRRIGPGRLPCATTLGRTLRDRPSRPAYRK